MLVVVESPRSPNLGLFLFFGPILQPLRCFVGDVPAYWWNFAISSNLSVKAFILNLGPNKGLFGVTKASLFA